MKSGYEDALRALDHLLERLSESGRSVVDAHVEEARAMDSRQDWSERGNLRLYVRDSGGAPVYEWSRVKWYGPKGKRKMVRTYIPKPHGAHMYSLTRLKGYAQDWEAPMVEKTEKALARIRKQQAFLMKARAYLRMAAKVDDAEVSDGRTTDRETS